MQAHGTRLYTVTTHFPQIAKIWPDYLPAQITCETPNLFLNKMFSLKRLQIPAREHFQGVWEQKAGGFVAGGTGSIHQWLCLFTSLQAEHSSSSCKVHPLTGRKDSHSSPFIFIAWLVICYHIRCSLGSTTCNMDMHPIKEIT